MLTPEQCDRLDVVLVSPRNPLNIGAAARAMANFGFHRLSIVAPFAQNWMEAKSAVGAPDLLRDAKVFDTLSEAVAHCTLVIGTGSLDRRRPVQSTLDLPEAAGQLRRAIAADGDGKIAVAGRAAIIFGSEKHGLTADDLSWCHAIAVIETSEDQPSMNLGQSVAVCLYEISRPPQQQMPVQKVKGAEHPEHPESGQLDRLAELIEETMDQVNYKTRGARSENGEALRVLLRRLMPNEADLRRMMGLFRRILWQIRRQTGKI